MSKLAPLLMMLMALQIPVVKFQDADPPPWPLVGQTTPANCKCGECKHILSGPFQGYYDHIDSEQGECNEGCFYRELGGQSREVCMCDPGDVSYADCDPVSVTSNCTIYENGEEFKQTNIFDEREETIVMSVPSHGNFNPSVVILNSQSDTNLLQSGNTCQLSSVPSSLNIKAMGKQLEKCPDRGLITPNKTIVYCVLKVTESRLGKKERNKLFKLVESQCSNHSIIRTRDIIVPKEFCEENGTIILNNDTATTTTQAISLSTQTPCLIVEACSKVGPHACGYGWTNPDPNASQGGFTFHQVSDGVICVTCAIGPGCDEKYCACEDIKNKEDLMDCRLCSDPRIENEINEDGTNFTQTTTYTCKDYNRRAISCWIPDHNYIQGIYVVMNARADGYWHSSGLKDNRMKKIGSTCYIDTLPSHVFPIDIAIGLQEIVAGNTVITEEDERVEYSMLINEGPIDDISSLHELVIDACHNITVVKVQQETISKEESETLRGGGVVYRDGPANGGPCVLKTANAMVDPQSGCWRWPNPAGGEEIAVHGLETAVTSVSCWDGVNCPPDLCFCSDIVDVDSLLACINRTGLTLIVHSSTNQPISGASAEVTKNGNAESYISNVGGNIEIPIYSFGTYQVSVEATGYITSDFSVEFTEFVPIARLVILYPIEDEGETKITLTWGDDTYDLDTHVMDIPQDNFNICRTWFSDMNGCPAISLDWDNTNTGLSGPEIVSLNDPDVNKHSIYAIAIMHYRAGSNAAEFLSSGAIVTVSDGRSPSVSSALVDPGYPVEHPDDWWFVGCVEVDTAGLFTLTTPPDTTFFDGSDSGFTSLATAYCGAAPLEAPDMDGYKFTLPPKKRT